MQFFKHININNLITTNLNKCHTKKHLIYPAIVKHKIIVVQYIFSSKITHIKGVRLLNIFPRFLSTRQNRSQHWTEAGFIRAIHLFIHVQGISHAQLIHMQHFTMSDA